MREVSGPTRRAVSLAVLVAALGYFVDIYDLILFGAVRIPSVTSLGFTDPQDIQDKGLFLLNMQLLGLLVGGVLWGIIGDKRGRLSVLFGSIILYSIANIVNGTVDTIGAYAACRILAGIGLAGELGAGITLVSELMDKEKRGLGTTIVAATGILGGVVAGIVAGAIPWIPAANWRTAFFIGGGMGIALLALRIGVAESGMFHTVAKNKTVSRGNFFMLFTDRKRLLRYLAVIGVGVPIWYGIGILIMVGPEIGGPKGLGLSARPSSATGLFYCYAFGSIGGFIAGLLSQKLRSRRRVTKMFMIGTAVVSVLYFLVGGTSFTAFYALCGAIGLSTGYWAVFVSAAAEQFGTNLRATVATTTPNFVRGSLWLLTTGLALLQKHAGMSIVGAAIAVGVVAFSAGFIGLLGMRETFAVDLDYVEE